MTALGMQAVIWTAIGLGFGALARPVVEPGRSPRALGAAPAR
jgi:hypothetical protein